MYMKWVLDIILPFQASQTSQVFDIQEDAKVEGGNVIHAAILASDSIRPAFVDDHNQRQPCPMCILLRV